MKTQQQKRAFPWFLFTVFLFLAVGILITGSLIFQNQQQQLKSDTHNNLAAIADLKARQITLWRHERLGDALIIHDNAAIARQVKNLIDARYSAKQKENLRRWMQSFGEYNGYVTIYLLDKKGANWLGSAGPHNSIDSIEQQLFSKTVRTKNIVFSDLHLSKATPNILLDILVPLIDPDKADTTIISVFLLRIDPYKVLFPLIQSWPTLSRTSETLLFESEHNEVVYLNELRHVKNTALTLRIPISEKQLPAAMAARGGEGMVEGIDYRGVPVLAAIRKIPDSPWYMEAKVDQKEIYAPLLLQSWIVGIAVFLLIVATGAVIGFWWRHQRARFYRQQYEAEIERKALVTHFDYLIHYANDIILLLKKDGKIIEANDQAYRTYGYTREEIQKLNIRDLRSPESRVQVEMQMKQVKDQNGMVFETEHLRKNGTIFPVEVSSRVIDIEGIPFHQSIIRDITERKRAEEALRESENRFRDLTENTSDWIWEVNTHMHYVYASPRIKELLGYTPAEVLGKTPFDLMQSTEVERLQRYMDEIKNNPRTFRNLENINVHKDGSLRVLETSGIPVYDKEGRFAGFRGIDRDITERKHVMEELQKREAQQTLVLSSLPMAFYIAQPFGDFGGTWVSKQIDRISGFTSEQFKSDIHLWASRLHPEDREYALIEFESILNKGLIELEYRWQAADGRYLWFLDRAVLIRDETGQPKEIIGTWLDITERKNLEEARDQERILLRTLIDNFPNSIFVKDKKYRKLIVNPKHVRRVTAHVGPAHAFSEKDLLGKTDFEVYPQELAERYFVEDQKVIEGGQSVLDQELLIIDADGQDHWELMSKIPLRNRNNEIIGLVGIGNDITTRKQAEKELADTKALLQAAFEQTPIPMVLVSAPDNIIRIANPACAEFLEYKDEPVPIGQSLTGFKQTWQDFDSEGNPLPITEMPLAMALRGITTKDKEYFVQRKDGTRRWELVSAAPIYNQTEELIAAILTFPDITDRKRAEEALRESEQRYRNLYENASVGIYRTTPDGKILLANPQLLSMLGYSSLEEIAARNLEHEGFEPTYPRINFRKTIERDGEIRGLESAWVKKDGSIIFVRENAKVVRDRDGKILYYDGIVEDITKRKRAEEQLQESEERYRHLVEFSPDAIAVHIDGKFVYVNPATVKLFNATDESQLLGLPVLDIVHPDDKEIVRQQVLIGMKERKALPPTEEKFIRFDGRIIDVEVTSLPTIFQGKPATQVVGRDITERKRAESVLRESEEQFRSLAEQSPNMIFINYRGRIVYANKRSEEIMGYTKEEFYAPDFNFLELSPREFQETLKENFQKHLRGEESPPIEYVLFTKSRKKIYAILASKMISYKGNQAILGIITDITERKHAEEVLGESEEKYRSLSENSLEGIGLSKGNQIIYANRALLGIFGYENLAEFIAKPLLEHVAPESINTIQDIFKKIKTGEPYKKNFTYKIIRKDGETRDVEISTDHVKIREEVYTQSTFRDITERKRAEEALRESEEKYRQLFEVESDALFLIDDETGKIIEANTAASKLYGYSREELLQMRNVDVSAQPDETHRAGMERSSTHIPLRYHRKKDGAVFPVEITAGCLTWHGRPAHMPAIRDISERIRMEEALRQSEALFKMLVESSPVAIAVFSSQTKAVEYVSHRFTELFGYELQEIPSMDDWWPLAYPTKEYRNKIRIEWQKELEKSLRENREFEPIESVVSCKDGLTKYIECTLSSTTERTFAFFSDLTQRQMAEEALRQTHAFNELLIQTMPFGMDIVDEEGNILFMSKAMKNLVGGDVLGTCCWKAYKDNKQQCPDCPLQKGITFGKPVVLETTGVFGGKTFQINHIGMMYEGKKAILEVFQDITEQKKLQQELLQSQKMLSMGTLAGGIAHDFNNILGIILGYVSILHSVKDNSLKFSDGVTAIKQSIERGAALVRQILMFARRTEVSFEPLNIPDLIQELGSMLQQTFPKVITFHASYNRHLPYINADHSQIHQALLNLCVNARDAMPNGGEITINAELVSGIKLKEQFPTANEEWYICISVSDTGIGMEETIRSRIFDPFFTTKEKGKGTGLGLSVVYGIIQAHFGFIDVESKVGSGTTFQIYLPVPPESSVKLKSTAIVEEQVPSGKETILLVEDEDLLLEMTQFLLEEHGYHVYVAKDGVEAVELYVQHWKDIALVITDMGLPKLTGVNEFEKLKEINPKVKVIFASGFFEPEVKTKLQEAGASGFLQKPYAIEGVLLKIHDALNKKT